MRRTLYDMRLRIAAVALGLLAPPLALPASADTAQVEPSIVVKSFDGIPIVATMFKPSYAWAGRPVPVVLRTHGWGGSREKSVTPFIQRLVDSGYAVLTYDSRGFGESGGEANIGSPDYEVRDASTLITYLASRPDVLRDGPGDPRVGWTGGSNAGGVQLNTAAFDHRVDAIVPEISWGNLVRDLMPNNVPKFTWDTALYGAGLAGAVPGGLASAAGPQTGAYAPQIHEGFVQITATGGIDQRTHEWFAHKSTTNRSWLITTPTLIVQGTIDTLFPLEDAFDNYRNLLAAGTPVKLLAYCAGHSLTGCPYPGGSSGYPSGAGNRRPIYEDRIVAWLDRWVKRVPAAIGAPVEWQAQDGVYYQAGSYPLPGTVGVRTVQVGGDTLTGPGRTGGDGPADGNPAGADEIQTTAIRYHVTTPARNATPMLGVPSVRLSGTLTGVVGHLYLELVDVAPNGTRVTVDDQVTPVRLTSGTFDLNVALHGVSWIIKPGHYLELEMTTGSAQYQHSRGGPYTVKPYATVTLPLTFTAPPSPSPAKPPVVKAPPPPKPAKDEHPCNKGKGKDKDENKGKGKDKCNEKDDDDDDDVPVLLHPRSM